MPPQCGSEEMINLDAIITGFWDQAVKSLRWDDENYDKAALAALDDKNGSWPKRRERIRGWLQDYRVFRVRGISAQKDKIADVVLTWADSSARERDLNGLPALCEAHEMLMKKVCDAYVQDCENKRRDFVSLTSKALWLCHPDLVPMFDSYAQRALWVLAKLDSVIATPPKESSTYCQFVSVWKQLYERHRATINSLDAGGYPHLVRIFDRILWMIGKDQYTIPK